MQRLTAWVDWLAFEAELPVLVDYRWLLHSCLTHLREHALWDLYLLQSLAFLDDSSIPLADLNAEQREAFLLEDRSLSHRFEEAAALLSLHLRALVH